MATLIFRFEQSDPLNELIGENYQNVIIENADISVAPIIHWLLYVNREEYTPREAVGEAILCLMQRFRQAGVTKLLPHDTKYNWLIEMDYENELITINGNWEIAMVDYEEVMRDLASNLTLADIHRELSNKRIKEYARTDTY